MNRSVVVLCGLIISAVVWCAPVEAAESETAALLLQLSLFDRLADKNPGYQDTLTAWRELEPSEKEVRLKALSERNARDPEIAALIDSLQRSGAYKLYYRQFRNVTPEIHRSIFTALPYEGIPSPGDVGRTQFELFQHRDSLRLLMEVIEKVNVDRAVTIARRWVPAAAPPAPVTYYIMDGNGDAFANDGHVCFDLFSVVLRKRPDSLRYSGLAAVPVDEIEAVLAHEFQHVFAEPYLYPPDRHFDTWPEQWEDIIARRMVSEGVALQCNPPAGFKKAVYEDTLTVKYWMRELERMVTQMKRGEVDEDSVRAWLSASYHDPAMGLLKDFLAREYAPEERAALRRDHAGERPSLVYTLGWWMVSHIVAAPGGRDAAVQLLSSPHELYGRYNATITDPELMIEF